MQRWQPGLDSVWEGCGWGQEQTSLLRKALAAAVSSELVWRPEIKEAQLTLTAHVKAGHRAKGA